MYLAYVLIAYSQKFSSPISFTCMVCQNFSHVFDSILLLQYSPMVNFANKFSSIDMKFTMPFMAYYIVQGTIRIFTSVQNVLFLHTPSLKAYYKNVDWLNLFHVQVQ